MPKRVNSSIADANWSTCSSNLGADLTSSDHFLERRHTNSLAWRVISRNCGCLQWGSHVFTQNSTHPNILLPSHLCMHGCHMLVLISVEAVIISGIDSHIRLRRTLLGDMSCHLHPCLLTLATSNSCIFRGGSVGSSFREGDVETAWLVGIWCIEPEATLARGGWGLGEATVLVAAGESQFGETDIWPPLVAQRERSLDVFIDFEI